MQEESPSMKVVTIGLIAGLSFLVAWGTAAQRAEARAATAKAASSSNSRVARGLEISPVPPDLNGRDRELVARGSYLVNAVGDCAGCHSFPRFLPGGDPFQGTPDKAVAPIINTRHFLAGGLCFGPTISSNLTPDLDTGHPANMTLQQFITAMRTGRSLSPDLLRAMPWPTYHNMNDGDLKAMYEYLSALPHAEPCNDSCPPHYSNSPDCPNPAPPQ
jgi:hypothetical protein